MTLQQITQFIDENRDKEKAYVLIDDKDGIICVFEEDFDAIGLTGIITNWYDSEDVEEINLTDLILYSGSKYKTMFLSVEIMEYGFYSPLKVTLTLEQATIYSSESVKQIVNSIQQDED